MMLEFGRQADKWKSSPSSLGSLYYLLVKKISMPEVNGISAMHVTTVDRRCVQTYVPVSAASRGAPCDRHCAVL